MRILITGSAGLIGGEAVEYFGARGHTISGVDNNMRREFFGPAGDTLGNLHRVANAVKNYTHHEQDIRDLAGLERHVFQGAPFDAVIHCAAQPSHDKAREIPLVDHGVNVTGTLNLLEATRRHSPNAVFIFMSTNKVYGDAPNELPFAELETRYDYAAPADRDGITETCRVDRSTHSIFGANKLAADVLVQEYARTYGLKTCALRGGCLTGRGHAGVELHGFLSYLVKTVMTGGRYRIYGYKGKQVRDNIHSYDVMRAMDAIIRAPRPGEVYNIGGGRGNSVSVLEAIARTERIAGKKLSREYVDQPRLGDHICYISDLAKFRGHYPNWRITRTLDMILVELVQTEAERQWWAGGHDRDVDHPLGEGSLVLDIGGYLGDWTARIVERYNPYVWVFEPIKEFYEACVARFKNNPKVTVFNVGLAGLSESFDMGKRAESSSMFHRGWDETVDLERVELRDVAAFMRERNVTRVDLVSINTEGAEYGILRRLLETNLISRCDNVQVQFHSFYPNAAEERDRIREAFSQTHVERYCYPFTWECWRKK